MLKLSCRQIKYVKSFEEKKNRSIFTYVNYYVYAFLSLFDEAGSCDRRGHCRRRSHNKFTIIIIIINKKYNYYLVTRIAFVDCFIMYYTESWHFWPILHSSGSNRTLTIYELSNRKENMISRIHTIISFIK